MANPKKIQATVKEVIPHGTGIYHVVITCSSRFPRFKPGQFLHLTVDEFDQSQGYWPESRVFSIARISEDRKEVSLIYSVKGVYTKKMEKYLEPGKEVWLKAPYGDFIISQHIEPGDRIILIAGGTGVSPFMPFLENPGENEIVLNYGLRSLEHMIFLDDFKKVFKGGDRSLRIFLESDEQPPANLKFDSLHRSVLDIKTIIDGATGNEKYFISGPPAMIDKFKNELTALGIGPYKIIIDEWG